MKMRFSRHLRLLTVLCLAFLALTGKAQDNLINGLVGYWSFDEGQGATARDFSGNGNDGVLKAGVSWAEGRVGGALQFDGTGYAYVQVPSSDSLNVSDGLTIAAWVKTESGGVIVSKWNDSGEWCYVFKSWSRIELSKAFHNDLIDLWGAGSTPQAWTHMATTFDSATGLVRLYVNGLVSTEGRSSGGSIRPCTADLLIGAVNLDPGAVTGENFAGLIDEVGLFNRALLPEEIQRLYEQGFGEPGPNTAPRMTSHPKSQTAPSGTSVTFKAAVWGTPPLRCQWRFDGTPLPEATTNLLTLSGVREADAGEYDVVVANDYGSVTSRVAVLTVLLKPPEIVTQPTDQSVLSGSSVSLSVLGTGSLPMTYQWLRNEVDLSDSVQVSGAKTATLTISAVGIEDVGVYSVVVRNGFGSVTSLPVALDVIMAPPRITGQPRSQAAALGSTVLLELQVTGSQPLSFQWRLNGADIVDGLRVSGSRASTLEIKDLSLVDLGSYTVIVSNTLGRVRSGSVELTTWSAILSVVVEAPEIVVTWNDAGKGITLQRTASLSNPTWEDVADSEKTTTMRFPITNAAAFFRLAMGSPSDQFVWIPPGTFVMGSPTNEVDRRDWEGPQTAVTISRGFWMGKYEVTQGEYLAVMGNNPSWFNGVREVWDENCHCSTNKDYGVDLNRPVERVSWDDATNYCAKLTERERLAGRIGTNAVYRLPTEAEWEYACRGWTSTRFSYGDDPGYTNLTNYAWYWDNSDGQTHPVGQKLPNPWGLYDMHGNVWEWCQDWWGEYPGGIALDPQGPAEGSFRVIRGGYWYPWIDFDFPGSCRSAYRRVGDPEYGIMTFGFRVVLAPGQP